MATERPTRGADESRAPEAVSSALEIDLNGMEPTSAVLPGTPTTNMDEDDLQAQRIRNLVKLKSRATQLELDTGDDETRKAPRKYSKWHKARAVISADSILTGQMMALRGLVGTDDGSATTIEETEELLRKEQLMQRGKWYIIMPDSTFKMGWDLSQVAVLLYVAAVVPLRIGFDTSSSPFSTVWWIEVFIDLYFLADVVLNFVTAFYSNGAGGQYEGRHEVITDLVEIRKQYMRGFFVIDVLSILPVNYIEQAISGGTDAAGNRNLKTLKILRLIRLTRLLRLARVKTLLKRYTDMLENLAGVFSLLSIIVVAIFLSHFVSCAWYWVGDQSEAGWVRRTFDCEDCVHSGSSLAERYLATYWWSLTLLLTAEMSNHIQPYRTGEILFVIMLQLMGAIVFGFIIGTVGTILMSWGLLEEKIARKLAELREFMNEKNVPKSTRKKVRKFMEDFYRTKAGYDETEVVSALPPAIALELLDSIYRGTLLKVPIFQDLDDDVICRICLLMKPLHVAKGEYVFKEKEPGREMYIIREGRVQILRFGMTIGVLHRNCFFGEDCMVQVEPGKKNLRQRTAFAIQDCELAFLRATDADAIALDYPEMLQSFQNLAAKKACVEHERLNMMINQVADELGVDPDSALMDGVLTAVSAIASEDEMVSVEVKAARKIANWWRHQKKRKAGLVKEKFPASLDVSEESSDFLKGKIRKIMKTSNLWKSGTVAVTQAGTENASSTPSLRPFPPAGHKRTGLNASSSSRRGETTAIGSNDLMVSLHSIQEQVDRMELTQKAMVAHQKETDLQTERLDAKLESIASVILKIDRKISS